MDHSLLSAGCRSGGRFFSAVLRPALFTISYTLSIERSANRVIANTRKVFNPATADQYDRVLLKVMADAWDIGRNFETVREANAANLTESGVRLLRSRGVNAGTNTASLRAALKRGRLRLPSFVVAALTDQLVDRWHEMQFFLSVRPLVRKHIERYLITSEDNGSKPLGTAPYDLYYRQTNASPETVICSTFYQNDFR